ncbi:MULTISPECIES: hypothetical protein [Actinosynnema]|uniref:hypothetical protein n=1 Tax=Actinosynnema TaxID=40566 RepID=UPI0020A2DC7F|nr:hypothetical protein [Actinosynnema pretiosum]MCP2099292.1 hypothetical protein [Actinosynnema pretiosum]
MDAGEEPPPLPPPAELIDFGRLRVRLVAVLFGVLLRVLVAPLGHVWTQLRPGGAVALMSAPPEPESP